MGEQFAVVMYLQHIPHPDQITPRKCVELLFSSLFVTRAGPQRCLRSYNKGVTISTPIMLVKCVYQMPTIPLPISSIFVSHQIPTSTDRQTERQTDSQNAQSQMPVVCPSIEDIDV